MKKILTTLIFASLAVVLATYAFVTLRWDGFEGLAIGSTWLHIGAYLAYSLLVPDKDHRIVYPMAVILILVLLNTFNVEFMGPITTILLLVTYVGFHLVVSTYMGKSQLKFIPVGGILSLSAMVVGVLFKIMHWPGAVNLVVLGTAVSALLLLLAGVSKNIERN